MDVLQVSTGLLDNGADPAIMPENACSRVFHQPGDAQGRGNTQENNHAIDDRIGLQHLRGVPPDETMEPTRTAP